MVSTYNVACIGHFIVTCDTLQPRTVPVEGVHMDMIRRGGLGQNTFFDYPALQQGLDSILYDLVVVIRDRNYLSEDTRLLSIHKAFTETGVICVMYTTESRVHLPNHHYLGPECYKKTSKRVNNKLQKSLKKIS